MPGVFIEVTQVGKLIIKQCIFLDLAILADEFTIENLGIIEDFGRQVGKFPVPGHDINSE